MHAPFPGNWMYLPLGHWSQSRAPAELFEYLPEGQLIQFDASVLLSCALTLPGTQALHAGAPNSSENVPTLQPVQDWV
jgi:hypothetical protein